MSLPEVYRIACARCGSLFRSLARGRRYCGDDCFAAAVAEVAAEHRELGIESCATRHGARPCACAPQEVRQHGIS